MTDAFAFVLHGHLPYARGAGRWPHGEEWLHEAILGTYLPLLVQLHDLRDAGVPYRLTIGLTPVLLEQLADADIVRRFDEYLTDQQRRAESDVNRFNELGDYALETLAARYVAHFGELAQAYRRRFAHDLVGGFRDLTRTGHLEALTSAATHGYLPLLRRPTAIRAQLRTGVASTRRLLGIEPSGVWLPECAYVRGLERYLEEAGLTHFFVDAPLLVGREVAPSDRVFKLAGDGGAGWATGDLLFGEEVVDVEAFPRVEAGRLGEADLLTPYLVGGSRVAAIARHPRVSGQVWSARHGYPGDASYREFHRKDDVSGLRYWRVVDPRVGLGEKELYDWDAAFARTRVHAAHFVELARDELAAHRAATGRGGLLVAAFDLELFGHWWFEGVAWLGETLRRFADGAPTTTSVAGYLAASPPTTSTTLFEGSWGKGNDHSTWLNDRTAETWPELDRAAEVLEDAVATTPRARLAERAVAQAARELLIAQASDWQFLITTGQAEKYARERFRTHLLRFYRALEIARRGGDERELAELEAQDNPFPDVDWRAYRDRGEARV